MEEIVVKMIGTFVPATMYIGESIRSNRIDENYRRFCEADKFWTLIDPKSAIHETQLLTCVSSTDLHIFVNLSVDYVFYAFLFCVDMFAIFRASIRSKRSFSPEIELHS